MKKTRRMNKEYRQSVRDNEDGDQSTERMPRMRRSFFDGSRTSSRNDIVTNKDAMSSIGPNTPTMGHAESQMLAIMKLNDDAMCLPVSPSRQFHRHYLDSNLSNSTHLVSREQFASSQNNDNSSMLGTAALREQEAMKLKESYLSAQRAGRSFIRPEDVRPEDVQPVDTERGSE